MPTLAPRFARTLFLALTLLAPPLLALPPAATYHGRQGGMKVATPRLDAPTTVDGRLDEPVWQQAALLTGFSQFFPADGLAADDSTDVLVWYSSTALHVGIRAHAPPGTVRATLADRDRITQDDNVQLFLGTYNDSRQAMVFSVNPFGIQSDGVIIETGAVQGGGFGGTTPRAREAVDLSPDYVWRSRGRLTDTGFEVEIEIPMKSLRYRSDAELTWQLHVVRTVQRSGTEQTWAPAVRAASSFLAQAGQLTGIRELARGLTLDVIPSITSITAGQPSPSGWRYTAQSPDLGGSLRWGVTSNLTLNATVNPDFSQVESDATQLQYDPRVAIFFPERRPFFLESAEQFSVPNNLVYTRRIVQPRASAKLTGKLGGFDVGLLSAMDNGEVSGAGGNPIANILRVQRDLGAQSRVGLLYTDLATRTGSNRLLGVDSRLVRGIFSARAQLVGSHTTDAAGVARTAPLFDVAGNILGRRFNAIYRARGISPDFQAQLGFINRPAVTDLSATHRFTFFTPKGALVEAFTPELFYSNTFRYTDVAWGRALEEKLHLRSTTRFRGGWQLAFQSLIETFRYDSSLYRNYRLLQPRTGGGVDTVRFTGTPSFWNLDWVLSFSSPELKRMAFNTTVVWGKDQNFPEWGAAFIASYGGGLTLRPTEQLRVVGTWTYDYFDRWRAGSRVLTRSAPRLRVEYQLTRQVFFRFIGELNRTQRDSLRDVGRTELPIYLVGSGGRLTRAAAFDRRNGRYDALFSYLPSPGTVVFMGYGSGIESNRPTGPTELQRTADALFVKVSYLFRAR
ncbi:MAG: carbohydrate binding family 9 domain-containing protein [Gemmatimonadaceae bacterium]|nr:carbohydrate binding family 9 domain-containing protein [Gemmatimonadaceae bacterium]